MIDNSQGSLWLKDLAQCWWNCICNWWCLGECVSTVEVGSPLCLGRFCWLLTGWPQVWGLWCWWHLGLDCRGACSGSVGTNAWVAGQEGEVPWPVFGAPTPVAIPPTGPMVPPVWTPTASLARLAVLLGLSQSVAGASEIVCKNHTSHYSVVT